MLEMLVMLEARCISSISPMQCCYLTGWLDRKKWSQLLFTESLGQVAVLHVPLPRCSRLSALNLNLAESDNFNIRDLRGKYRINIPVQMASLKGGSLAEFLGLKLKMSSIIWVYTYNSSLELRILKWCWECIKCFVIFCRHSAKFLTKFLVSNEICFFL